MIVIKTLSVTNNSACPTLYGSDPVDTPATPDDKAADVRSHTTTDHHPDSTYPGCHTTGTDSCHLTATDHPTSAG